MTAARAHAGWLTSRVILIAGNLEAVDGSVGIDAREAALRTDSHAYGEGTLVVAHLPGAEVGGAAGAVTLGASRVPVPELDKTASGVRALARNQLSGLSEEQRRDVLAFLLASTAADMRGPDGVTLARNLARIREALREQLPRLAAGREDPVAVRPEVLYGIDDETFWFKGWLHDPEHAVTDLTAVSPEGARGDLLEGAFRHRRVDIEETYATSGEISTERHGLIRMIAMESPSRLSDGWIVELHTSTGAALEVPGPAVEREIPSVRAHILSDMSNERPGEDELVREHVHPALSRLQRRLEKAIGLDAVIDVGSGHPRSPEVTVIVPLYKRIDFLEHQLAQFAHDPEIGAVDLLYVLDSPEVADDLLEEAHVLSRLHAVPLRVALMKQNAGFSGANNAAASVARGRRLLLLNSDVLPDRPGWIGKMSAFYAATPNIGALGPKLLYEDDSLQHAGMYFYRKPGSRLWGNQHYFKGLHRSFPAANVARAVPAVTAACMMVDAELYERAGGLSYAYVQGAYEDSDFCLRLIDQGCQNWYMPGAELYHLEAQSYPSHFRKLATQYNMWLHTHTWNDRIEAVCGDYEAPSVSRPAVAEHIR